MLRKVSAQEAEAWQAWDSMAEERARQRWRVAVAKGQDATRQDGRAWIDAIQKRIVPLGKCGIVDYIAHTRIKRVAPHALPPSGRSKIDRITDALPANRRKNLFPIAIDSQEEDGGGHGIIRLYPSRLIVDGELSLLVLIDEHEQRPLSMSVMLRGFRPGRLRSVYLRYDLDAEEQGTGPVAHFNAHWHSGDLPDAADAEEFDPRLPSAILGPDDVIDILVKTFYPKGPQDLAPEGTSFDAERDARGRRSRILSERLRSLSQQAGLTPAQLGEQAGLDQTFVADVLEAQRGGADIGLEALEGLASALGLPGSQGLLAPSGA